MATITLRIEDSIRDQLQSMADGRDTSLSELLREAIDGLFDRDDREQPRRPVVPESISSVDRRQLALLHRILARLVEDQAADERLAEDGDANYQLDRAEALEAGWTMEYETEFAATQPELSRRDCGLVMDILDMFRVIKASMKAVEDVLTEDAARVLTFHGFDANDELESRLLGYAQALIADGRWQEHAALFAPKSDHGNSHSPWLATYRRMLGAYEPIWRKVIHRGGRSQYHLTAEELNEVAAAATTPPRPRRVEL